jgi:amidase
MFVEALEQARALDRDFQATGKIKGPLHGVPVSIKDQINIKGYDTTIGFSAWCNKPASKDAALVQMVKEAGGIIMYKTNVPQTLLNFECANPVWGVTSNPWNKGYTCGGSTGGEGVVLASDASALGIGTDVGGSLRIPALYCGVYSLKPAAGRVSRQGLGASNRGFNGIPITAGPMARTMDDLDLLSRLMFAYTPANDYEGIAPVPYRDPQLPSKLKIGYYFEDDWIRTSPANRRAVQETVDALKRAGHDLVPFDLPFGPKSIQMFAAITSGDGYKTLLSHRVNDPIEKNLFLIRLGPRLPRWFQLFAAWVIENILKDPLFAQTFRRSKISNLTEYWEDYAIIKDMNEEFYDRVWNKHKFDAIIAPGMAAPALPHGATTNLSPLANGTFYYNVIDSPVGAIPVTIVDPTRDKLTQEWWEGNGGYRGGSWILNNRLYGARREGGVYDVEKMKGLPVGEY